MLDLNQGTLVQFNVDENIRGIGKVCGFASTPIYIAGRMVILEIVSSEGIDKETYPYTHVVFPEVQLKTAVAHSEINQMGLYGG